LQLFRLKGRLVFKKAASRKDLFSKTEKWTNSKRQLVQAGRNFSKGPELGPEVLAGTES
jgi:hypothetical protein